MSKKGRGIGTKVAPAPVSQDPRRIVPGFIILKFPTYGESLEEGDPTQKASAAKVKRYKPKVLKAIQGAHSSPAILAASAVYQAEAGPRASMVIGGRREEGRGVGNIASGLQELVSLKGNLKDIVKREIALFSRVGDVVQSADIPDDDKGAMLRKLNNRIKGLIIEAGVIANNSTLKDAIDQIQKIFNDKVEHCEVQGLKDLSGDVIAAIDDLGGHRISTKFFQKYIDQINREVAFIGAIQGRPLNEKLITFFNKLSKEIKEAGSDSDIDDTKRALQLVILAQGLIGHSGLHRSWPDAEKQSEGGRRKWEKYDAKFSSVISNSDFSTEELPDLLSALNAILQEPVIPARPVMVDAASQSELGVNDSESQANGDEDARLQDAFVGADAEEPSNYLQILQDILRIVKEINDKPSNDPSQDALNTKLTELRSSLLAAFTDQRSGDAQDVGEMQSKVTAVLAQINVALTSMTDKSAELSSKAEALEVLARANRADAQTVGSSDASKGISDRDAAAVKNYAALTEAITQLLMAQQSLIKGQEELLRLVSETPKVVASGRSSSSSSSSSDSESLSFTNLEGGDGDTFRNEEQYRAKQVKVTELILGVRQLIDFFKQFQENSASVGNLSSRFSASQVDIRFSELDSDADTDSTLYNDLPDPEKMEGGVRKNSLQYTSAESNTDDDYNPLTNGLQNILSRLDNLLNSQQERDGEGHSEQRSPEATVLRHGAQEESSERAAADLVSIKADLVAELQRLLSVKEGEGSLVDQFVKIFQAELEKITSEQAVRDAASQEGADSARGISDAAQQVVNQAGEYLQKLVAFGELLTTRYGEIDAGLEDLIKAIGKSSDGFFAAAAGVISSSKGDELKISLEAKLAELQKKILDGINALKSNEALNGHASQVTRPLESQEGAVFAREASKPSPASELASILSAIKSQRDDFNQRISDLQQNELTGEKLKAALNEALSDHDVVMRGISGQIQALSDRILQTSSKEREPDAGARASSSGAARSSTVPAGDLERGLTKELSTRLSELQQAIYEQNEVSKKNLEDINVANAERLGVILENFEKQKAGWETALEGVVTELRQVSQKIMASDELKVRKGVQGKDTKTEAQTEAQTSADPEDPRWSTRSSEYPRSSSSSTNSDEQNRLLSEQIARLTELVKALQGSIQSLERERPLGESSSSTAAGGDASAAGQDNLAKTIQALKGLLGNFERALKDNRDLKEIVDRLQSLLTSPEFQDSIIKAIKDAANTQGAETSNILNKLSEFVEGLSVDQETKKKISEAISDLQEKITGLSQSSSTASQERSASSNTFSTTTITTKEAISSPDLVSLLSNLSAEEGARVNNILEHNRQLNQSLTELVDKLSADNGELVSKFLASQERQFASFVEALKRDEGGKSVQEMVSRNEERMAELKRELLDAIKGETSKSGASNQVALIELLEKVSQGNQNLTAQLIELLRSRDGHSSGNPSRAADEMQKHREEIKRIRKEFDEESKQSKNSFDSQIAALRSEFDSKKSAPSVSQDEVLRRALEEQSKMFEEKLQEQRRIILQAEEKYKKMASESESVKSSFARSAAEAEESRAKAIKELKETHERTLADLRRSQEEARDSAKRSEEVLHKNIDGMRRDFRRSEEARAASEVLDKHRIASEALVAQRRQFAQQQEDSLRERRLFEENAHLRGGLQAMQAELAGLRRELTATMQGQSFSNVASPSFVNQAPPQPLASPQYGQFPAYTYPPYQAPYYQPHQVPSPAPQQLLESFSHHQAPTPFRQVQTPPRPVGASLDADMFTSTGTGTDPSQPLEFNLTRALEYAIGVTFAQENKEGRPFNASQRNSVVKAFFNGYQKILKRDAKSADELFDKKPVERILNGSKADIAKREKEAVEANKMVLDFTEVASLIYVFSCLTRVSQEDFFANDYKNFNGYVANDFRINKRVKKLFNDAVEFFEDKDNLCHIKKWLEKKGDGQPKGIAEAILVRANGSKIKTGHEGIDGLIIDREIESCINIALPGDKGVLTPTPTPTPLPISGVVLDDSARSRC